MKLIASLALLIIPLINAQGASPTEISLTCATYPLSTTFVMFEKDKRVYARMIFHYGSGYAPAISGIFTPNDMPTLKKWADRVRKIPKNTLYSWPVEACKKEGPHRIRCFGNAKVEEGEGAAKLTPFAIYTTRATEEGIAGKLESVRVRLALGVDGESSGVEMKYPLNECLESGSL